MTFKMRYEVGTLDKLPQVALVEDAAGDHRPLPRIVDDLPQRRG